MLYDICLFRRNPEQLDYVKIQTDAASRAMAAQTAWSLHKEACIHEIAVDAVDPFWEAWQNGDKDFDGYAIPSVFVRDLEAVSCTFPFREL